MCRLYFRLDNFFDRVHCRDSDGILRAVGCFSLLSAAPPPAVGDIRCYSPPVRSLAAFGGAAVLR